MTGKDKISTALIVNAFVIPGGGHIMIGQKIKGYLIASLVVLFLFIPVFLYTLGVLNSMRMIGMPATSMINGLEALSKSWEINRGVIIPSFIAILVLWIYGILDILIIKKRIKGELKDGM